MSSSVDNNEVIGSPLQILLQQSQALTQNAIPKDIESLKQQIPGNSPANSALISLLTSAQQSSPASVSFPVTPPSGTSEPNSMFEEQWWPTHMQQGVPSPTFAPPSPTSLSPPLSPGLALTLGSNAGSSFHPYQPPSIPAQLFMRGTLPIGININDFSPVPAEHNNAIVSANNSSTPTPSLVTPGPSSNETPVKTGKRRNKSANASTKSRKKTPRACVYCQRSHSCCDNFRPCSKCIARGIGHLCRDGEPKKIKKKKFLYLMEDNNAASNPATPPQRSIAQLTGSQPSASSSTTANIDKTINNPTGLPPIFSLTEGNRKFPFPKDIRISFHRLARRCGWSPELTMMWTKVEEFWRYRDSTDIPIPPSLRRDGEPSFRKMVAARANAIMQTVLDVCEPIVIWSEGLRIYAANKAALAFFGCSADEMTNTKFGYEDDKEDEQIGWNPIQDAQECDGVFRLFDLVHDDDATIFGCSAAADAMSLYPDYVVNGEPVRGFRMKIRVNVSKRQANSANVAPPMTSYSSAAQSTTNNDDSVICAVTQTKFRDTKGRFLFASCSFVRIDDL